MEERFSQDQPDRTSPVESAGVLHDGGSVNGLPDWPFNDFDEAFQTGEEQASPQLMALQDSLNGREDEDTGARPSPDDHNDSAAQNEAPPRVPTAIMSNMSPAPTMQSLPDFLHSDSHVDLTRATPSKALSHYDAVLRLGAPPSVPTAILSDMAPTRAAVPSLPDLLHSDRDQLYFDRAHPFVPILNERRYHSWSHSSFKTDAQICLQQTMWALATSASAQPQSVGDALYQNAVQRLEEFEAKGRAHQIIDIMQVQAWLLLAFYEFMRVDFRHGWMTAGRAFRLIQLMRLHELDLFDLTLSIPTIDWVDTEERRRTFWLAYSLDRFVSLSNGSPATINEQAAVRMPAPHPNFQSGHPVVTSFLSEVMLAQDASVKDSFTELVIMATICGRALAHRHQSMAWAVYSDSLQALWDRHRRINTALASSINALVLNHPPGTTHTDPILLFTHAMAQSMVLYMYKLMGEILPVSDEANQTMVDECARSFNAALAEVVNLAQTLSHMSCFKAHPLCPIPLYLCVENLTGFNEGGGVFDEQLTVIYNALNSLKRINILGQRSQSGNADDLGLLASPALALTSTVQGEEK